MSVSTSVVASHFIAISSIDIPVSFHFFCHLSLIPLFFQLNRCVVFCLSDSVSQMLSLGRGAISTGCRAEAAV